MSTKKMVSLFFIAMSMTLITPAFANNTATNETPKEVMAKQIEARLVEIKKMDKSSLTTVEKKELRKEVKDLRKKATNNGIYLSVGAVIIIILLLILIL